jgi:hypothetical protein
MQAGKEPPRKLALANRRLSLLAQTPLSDQNAIPSTAIHRKRQAEGNISKRSPMKPFDLANHDDDMISMRNRSTSRFHKESKRIYVNGPT